MPSRPGSSGGRPAWLHGPVTAPVLPADPRPHVADGRVEGSRCSRCGHVAARRHPRCERCLGPTEDRTFGPGGTVWSSTDVHIAVGERAAPFTVAYVDLDDGPRVLARVVPDGEVPSGTSVRLTGVDDRGDLVVAPVDGRTTS